MASQPATAVGLSAILASPPSIDLLTDPRPRRMLLTLLGVWLMSGFDLFFTLAEYGSVHFLELNPIAAVLLEGPPFLVGVYKFALLGFGTLILMQLRHYAVAELGCWFLLSTTTYVTIRWYVYYECITVESLNPLLDTLLGRL